MTAVLGFLGCGKTTTLNLIAGFIDPDRGTIRFGERLIADAGRGVVVPSNKRDLGMVFQSYALWPHLKASPTTSPTTKMMHKVPRAEREDVVRRALQRVRLLRPISTASRNGFLGRRAAWRWRAIAYAAQILLFDEPSTSTPTGEQQRRSAR